jgi:hypothetical protein
VYTIFLWGNLRDSDHLQDPCVGGKIILRWIFKKWKGDMNWIDLAQDRDRWAGCGECGDEPSVSIKCGEFLE